MYQEAMEILGPVHSILDEGHCPKCDSEVATETVEGSRLFHCERCMETWSE